MPLIDIAVRVAGKGDVHIYGFSGFRQSSSQDDAAAAGNERGLLEDPTVISDTFGNAFGCNLYNAPVISKRACNSNLRNRFAVIGESLVACRTNR